MDDLNGKNGNTDLLSALFKNFKHKWILECAIEVTARDPETSKPVQSTSVLHNDHNFYHKFV